jgi:hypothetical protein
LRFLITVPTTTQTSPEADKGAATKKEKAPKQSKARAEEEKKLSALDAAAKLLAETGCSASKPRGRAPTPC